jgi:hypothetical protein
MSENPIPPPKLSEADYQRMWDDAHRQYIDKSQSISKTWFEAVWSYLVRNKYEIKKKE